MGHRYVMLRQAGCFARAGTSCRQILPRPAEHAAAQAPNAAILRKTALDRGLQLPVRRGRTSRREAIARGEENMHRFHVLASATALSLAAALFGCSQPVETADLAVAAPTAEVSTAPLAARFNAFANAVHAGDPTALRATLAEEMLSAAEADGIERYLALQKDLMNQTFGVLDNGPAGGFTVQSAEVEGDAVRATVAFRGKTMEKEIFFVREGEAYKLNLLRPGFTRVAPDSAAMGYDTYTVRNTSPYNSLMKCSADNGMKPFTAPANGTTKVSCRNTCHWYRWGSWFEDAGGRRLRCTWNTFGSDVNIYPGRWECKAFCG
jgi:hypothetical protein